MNINELLNENVKPMSFLHQNGIYEATFSRFELADDTTDVYYFYFTLKNGDSARIRVGIQPIVKKDGTNVVDKTTGKALSGLDLLLQNLASQVAVEMSGKELLERCKTHVIQLLNQQVVDEKTGKTYDNWSASLSDISAFNKKSALI